MDEAFRRTYEAEFVREQPGFPTELRHYPSGAKASQEGRIVRVKPQDGNPWIGVFAFGRGAGSDQLFTCPNPDWLCVVARNLAYLVNSRDPEQWEIVNRDPVMQVLPAEQANLLLFADYTDIEAWGPTGFAWRSARLSLDGLQDLRVEGTVLRGEGWHPDCWEEFTLDLGSGRHEGGPALPAAEETRDEPSAWRRLLQRMGMIRQIPGRSRGRR